MCVVPAELNGPVRTVLMMTVLALVAGLAVNAGLLSQRLVREIVPVVALLVAAGAMVLAITSAPRSSGRATLTASLVTNLPREAASPGAFRAWLVSALWALCLALFAASTGFSLSSYTTVPVLTYHRVGVAPHPGYPVPVVSPEAFRAQMAFLKAHGYQTVTPEELERYWRGGAVRLPVRPLLITFDDGWRDNYAAAYPILKEYGFTAVISVTTGELNRRAMLRWPEVEELARAGFTIGIHSREHLRFGSLTAEERLTQLEASLRDLKERAGIAARTFTYPYGDGDLDRGVWADIKRSGVTMAFASHNFGLNVRPPAPFAVRRVFVSGDKWLGGLTLNLLLW